MSFGKIGRNHQFIVPECSLYLIKVIFLCERVAENTKEIRIRPKKSCTDRHRINAQLNAVAAFIIGKAVL
jgi:hypothetical protein